MSKRDLFRSHTKSKGCPIAAKSPQARRSRAEDLERKAGTEVEKRTER